MTSTSLPTHSHYKGFVAGVFSGVSKLAVGHPFDTIKVRLQTSSPSQFPGALSCLLATIRREGVPGLYKGATPPLIGWMFMDSLMLGSLTFYKRILNDNLFNPILTPPSPRSLDVLAPNLSHAMEYTRPPLPTAGHALAGIMAGWTVSFIAAPVEHIKARLQIQYAVSKAQRTYSGPIDCFRKIYRSHSLPGLYHGLSATILFRTFFFVWWGSYNLIQRALHSQTSIPLSLPTVQFLAGGLSAQLFWCASYPSDVIKQRIMTGPLENRGRGMWRATATALYRQQGWKGFWRGFLPCFLRAFPANATALAAFEGVMRVLP